MPTRPNAQTLAAVTGFALLMGLCLVVYAATTAPTDIQQPGTQPNQGPAITSPDNCDNCHDDPGGAQDRQLYPGFGWRGGMMANAGRDPIFWATVAVAEQDFLPGSDPARRGGAGDLCLRCHSVNGWLSGRSTPTDGSGLSATNDTNGVECDFCHMLVNPDQPVNISGTTEAYQAPFEAYDPATGEPYLGSGMYVLNGTGVRLGPFSDANAKHQFLASPFHRQAELCGTCHDVSNAAVGDLAHNNGAQVPLAAGRFSGVPGSSVTGKAAFNNPAYAYGIVERTFSEYKAGVLDTTLVNGFNALPADLRVAGGALANAYHRAWDARSNANYEDGAPRYFTCQTCHMAAATGVGCNKAGTPTRTDLPRHDQSGSGYWMPDAVLWQNDHSTLRLGGGVTQTQRDALVLGKTRAGEMIRSAASLGVTQAGMNLVVRVTNLTGHKLISGYPEGRRMWLNVRWKDTEGAVIAQNGAYGSIGRAVNDNAGTPHQVESILDLAGTVVFETRPGLDQQWAGQLVALGYPADLPLAFNRMTDAVEATLGQLAAAAPGTEQHSFHFAINNVITRDNRIPPYGFSRDEARTRNTLPVPETQYGNPAPGGTYDHWADVPFAVPAGAASAEVRLYYQQTSWEYVQFLWKANDRLSPFLGNEGVNMLDAWLNTGMSPPIEMASSNWVVRPFAPPITGLRFTGGTSIVWDLAPPATHYDLMRGRLSAMLANRSIGDALCVADDLAVAAANDPETPSLGDGFYYVTRGDGPLVLAGTYDDPPGMASPDEGRDAEVASAGGTACTDVP